MNTHKNAHLTVYGRDLLVRRILQHGQPRSKRRRALPQDEAAISYCGSGISACQIILACAVPGRPGMLWQRYRRPRPASAAVDGSA